MGRALWRSGSDTHHGSVVLASSASNAGYLNQYSTLQQNLISATLLPHSQRPPSQAEDSTGS